MSSAPRAQGRVRLTLLGRPGCHLCEEFRDELEQAFPGRFELIEACVDERPDWREKFGARVPVLLSEDGRVIGETKFDPSYLRSIEVYGQRAGLKGNS